MYVRKIISSKDSNFYFVFNSVVESKHQYELILDKSVCLHDLGKIFEIGFLLSNATSPSILGKRNSFWQIGCSSGQTFWGQDNL